MHPAIYDGDLKDLLKEYEDKHAGRDQECVALVQAVTNVGYTGKWQTGTRVVELNYLEPWTEVANFKIVD